MSAKYIYLFHEGDKDQKDLLGGKGANLAEMTNMGLPVPPGFTVTTVACNEYTKLGMQLPDGLMDQVRAALATTEAAASEMSSGDIRDGVPFAENTRKVRHSAISRKLVRYTNGSMMPTTQ